MSESRREYDVYLESELFLGIACGEFVVPPNIEVFKVREVLEGETEAADDNYRLREDNERLLDKDKDSKSVIRQLCEENERLREKVKDLKSVIRSYQTGFADEQ